MNKHIRFSHLASVTILLPLLVLVGCGGQAGSPQEAIPTSEAPKEEVKKEIVSPVARPSLVGSWKGDCRSVVGGIYSRFHFVFNETTFEQTVTYYSDSTCAIGIYDARLNGTYADRGNASQSPAIEKLDALYSVATMKPLTPAAAATLGANSYCGITNWVANEARDVTACSIFASRMGSTFYSIYSIQDATLKLGKPTSGHGGASEAERHVELDPDLTVTRVP